MRKAFVLSAMILAVLCCTAYAQYNGTIRGTVTDPSGAVVAGATVTAINPATGEMRTTTTNTEGQFTFTAEPPGTYEVRVKHGSFKEFVARGVELHVSSTAEIPAQLSVGKASEMITVEANALQVQTDSASLGGVVEGTQVTELPINGRSFKSLVLLEPGVVPRDNLNLVDKGLEGGSDFSVNGNPVTNNLWLVDGVNDNDLGSNRTILIYPSIDAIAEFKFVTNSYGPEYGQASGGIVSVITKSGTNQFHGTAYYSGRNDAINARPYFASGKVPLKRNDYGFSFGGPVKKDKLFFFWSEEWNKQKQSTVRGPYCVPTAAERAGDFTAAWQAWKDAGSNPDSVVDQCNAALPAVPGSRTGGNKVGTELDLVPTALDPAGVLIQDNLPLPTSANIAPNSGNNWTQAFGTTKNWRQDNARGDFVLNHKNTISFRFTNETWTNPGPNSQAYWGDDPFPSVEGAWSQPSKSVMLKDVSVLSSTLTNEAQLSYSNNRIYATIAGTGISSAADPLGNSYSPTQFVQALEAAIPPAFPEPKKALGMPPDAAWGGFGSYGGGQTLWLIAPWNNTSDLYNFRDDLAKVQGNHTLKAGIFIGYNKKHEPAEGGHDQPEFTFNNGSTTNSAYNNMFDLLTVGSTYGFSENSANLFPTAIWHDYEFYVQDNWRVRKNLTIEYGFRWSFLRQPVEQHGNITSWDLNKWSADLAASNPGDPCNGLVVVPGTNPCAKANAIYGTNFSSGSPGVNTALVPNNNHAIAPRIGVSWDPRNDGKTAVRFGIGQFYQRERVSRVTNLMGQNAPFSLSFNSTRTLDIPVSAVGGNASPTASTTADSFIPNSWQWNVSVQHELARDTTLQLGYVGNRGLHLTSDRDANGLPLDPQQRALFVFQGTPICGVLDCPTVTRPASNFGGIDQFGHAGSSSYHSLQVAFKTKIRSKSIVQAAYTWSHAISNVDLSDSSGSGFGTHSQTDPYNINGDRGNSRINRPHMFIASAVYYLPTFAGANAFAKQALGGWEFNSIFRALSGDSETNFFNASLQDVNYCIAPDGSTIPGCSGNNISDVYGTGNGAGNINAGRFMQTGTACNLGGDHRVNGVPQLWNPAAFTLVGYQFGTIGNSPKGYCFGPKNINLDVAMYKTWKIAERLSIQFRFDAFDLFNHPLFQAGNINGGLSTGIACGTTACSPDNNVVTAMTGTNSSTFGTVAATQPHGNRELQYGLRFIF